MRVKQLRVNDIDQIKRIVTRCKGLILHTDYTYWTLLYNFRNLCFGIEKKNEMIGFITGVKNSTSKDTLFVWQLGVLSAHRRKGYATKLLQEFVHSASKIGCKKIRFTIEKPNSKSKNFFFAFAQEKGYSIKSAGSVDSHEFKTIYEMGL